MLEEYFAMMFEDIRHEFSLSSLKSLTDTDVLSQSKFADRESIKKHLDLEKPHRQRILKEYVTVQILD